MAQALALERSGATPVDRKLLILCGKDRKTARKPMAG
jgi:hypothetical protein